MCVCLHDIVSTAAAEFGRSVRVIMRVADMKEEWGHEKRGDVPLFEKMALEGAQAGLSWATILHKRDGYRQAFHNFDIDKCAGMTPADVARLMDAQTATIVRNRAKIEAVINNAKCVQQLIASADGPAPTHGHFDAFLWSFVGGTPQLNAWPDPKSIPCESDTAHEMSKALKAKGFKLCVCAAPLTRGLSWKTTRLCSCVALTGRPRCVIMAVWVPRCATRSCRAAGSSSTTRRGHQSGRRRAGVSRAVQLARRSLRRSQRRTRRSVASADA